MQPLKIIVPAVFVLALAGCGGMPDLASRSAPFEAVPPAQAGAAPAAVTPVAQPGGVATAPRAGALSVSQINVTVPRTLSVSEANSYYPRADIVWRGDLIGDRHAQVQAILEQAFAEGTASLSGPTAVVVDVQLVRFHSLTEKARYSVGGVHNIVFDLTVRRASTGQPLAPTRRVVADLEAFGGKMAIEADRRGETQKVRVLAFLRQTIRNELAKFVSG